MSVPQDQPHQGDSQPSTVDPHTTRPPESTPQPPVAPNPGATAPPDVPSTLPFEPAMNEDASVWPHATGSQLGGESSKFFAAEQRYRVIREIALGGLGQVLLSHDEVFGREAALKQILHLVGDDAAMYDRFLVEAHITGNVEHPGIVGVYAIVRDSTGQPFYVMRLVRGESLKEAIRQYHEAGSRRASAERTLAFRKLINRLIDACNAVAFAHSRGVLHRDIKPANILVGKYGETLVVDWGLAKRLYKSSPNADSQREFRDAETNPAEMTASGQVVGTPAYMSPEQAQGR